jgi:hypothetical protein
MNTYTSGIKIVDYLPLQGGRIDLAGHGEEWGDPIVGIDKCIYWPKRNGNRVLKFDPETQQFPSIVWDDLQVVAGRTIKWQGGALASIPCYSTPILAIDLFKEISMTLQNNFTQHPQELLGRLFLAMDEECDETFFESSLRKFGIDKVFERIEECLPLDAEWADTHSNTLPLFMVAASCENCAASVIFHLLRRNVHAMLANYSYEDRTNIQNKKRKLGSN